MDLFCVDVRFYCEFVCLNSRFMLYFWVMCFGSLLVCCATDAVRALLVIALSWSLACQARLCPSMLMSGVRLFGLVWIVPRRTGCGRFAVCRAGAVPPRFSFTLAHSRCSSPSVPFHRWHVFAVTCGNVAALTTWPCVPSCSHIRDGRLNRICCVLGNLLQIFSILAFRNFCFGYWLLIDGSRSG